MVTGRARMTVLAPDVADQHEQHPDAGCLTAPDGDTCCQNTATHRVTFRLLALDGDLDRQPVTFACAGHLPLYLGHPGVATIREVHR